MAHLRNRTYSPKLSIHDVFRLLLFLIPVDANIVAVKHDELISTIGVAQPPSQMLLLFKGLYLRRFILLVDSAFAPISINIRKLVNEQGMLLVEGSAIEGFHSGSRLLRCSVFDEGITKPEVSLRACHCHNKDPYAYPSVIS